MIGTVFSVFLLLLVGYGLKKLRILRAEDAIVLNEVVIYVMLPAFIFMAIYDYKMSIPISIVKVPVIGFAIICVMLLAAYAVGKAMKLDNGTLAGFILVAGFGNTGFLGYPVVQAAFTDRLALVAAVLYDEIANALPLYIIGIIIVAAFTGKKANHSQVTSMLKLPQLWAVPARSAFRQFHIPTPLVTALDYLAKGTVPLVMISIGLTLTAKSLKRYSIPIAVVSFMKLAMLPLITFYVARLGGMTGVVHQSTVIEAGMPTATMAMVLVLQFSENAEFVAAVIFVTAILSIITIPATLLLLGVPAH